MKLQNNFTFIDLPGDPVQYVTFDGQLDIILRRHRDIIINVNLPSPLKSFTLESEKDWFYHPDKKIRTKKISITNGEQVHIWTSRNFKGSLAIKSGKTTHISFEVEKIFKTEAINDKFGDYKYKPAPLILSTSSNKSNKAPTDNSQEIMHIIDVKSKNNAPDYIINAIQKGSSSLDLDSYGIITIDWICGQIAASIGYHIDNNTWIKEIRGIKIKLQRAANKYYIIFKGNPRTRSYLTGTRYGTENTKVVSILAGAGSFRGTAQAAWNACNPALLEKGSLKLTGAGFAIFFSIAISVAEWYADYKHPTQGQPQKDFFDLAASIGIGIGKTIIAGGLASILISAIATPALATLALTPPGWVIVAGAIAVSIIIGFAVDHLDKSTSTTDKTASKLRSAWQYLENKEPAQYNKARLYGKFSYLHPATNSN